MIVSVSAREQRHVCACARVCVCSSKHRITRKPYPYGTSGNPAKLSFFPDQIIPVPFNFASKIQIYKHQNEPLMEARTTLACTCS